VVDKKTAKKSIVFAVQRVGASRPEPRGGLINRRINQA
jgi:hypothetical protein